MYFSRRHGYYKYTSTSASVERNLLELNKKFNKPKQPINPFIRFLVKYKPLFIAKYPTASLYGMYSSYFMALLIFFYNFMNYFLS